MTGLAATFRLLITDCIATFLKKLLKKGNDDNILSLFNNQSELMI
jgi:hypothetical protein